MAVTNPLSALIRYQGGKQVGWAWNERQQYYERNVAYYNNNAYQPIQLGGFKEYIAAEFGVATAQLFAGLFNPIKRVVDLYSNIFSGGFGDEITVDAVDPARDNLTEHIGKIWGWSNINVESQLLTLRGPTNGTEGIRIVARSKPTPRVSLKFEHAGRIKDIELDDRGNVKQVLLEYQRLEGALGEQREPHTIRELLTATEFVTWRDDRPWDLFSNSATGPLSRYPNPLGVCPYVLLRHTNMGDTWGLPPFAGHEVKIDLLNMLIGHIVTQIIRHVKVKWLLAASGNAPKEIDLGDTTVAYIKLDPAVSTQPSMQAMVSNLSLADSLAMANTLMDEIRDALPELKATDGKFLAGQSGETVAQLRQPAEQLVLRARENYEDALVRAQKIALSWGIMLKLWDLGTGTGNVAAAESAYQGGYEDHTFNKRPGLPASAFELANLEGKNVANVKTRADTVDVLVRANAISPEEKIRYMHPDWDDAQIKDEIEAINATATPEPETLGPIEGSGASDPLVDQFEVATPEVGEQGL